MSAFSPAPYGPADRIEIADAPLAVIRHEGITIADLRDAFDGGYQAIGALFANASLVPTGPAVAVYYGDPRATFDLELGFPVAVAPADTIATNGLVVQASTLPAGPATATTVLGSYDGLGDAWMGLAERTVAAGGSPRGIWIEVYVSDPTVPPEELRTDLILPLA